MPFSTTIESAVANPDTTLRRFTTLLKPMNDASLNDLAHNATRITRQHFGRTMRMFAPLYLSNECINSCSYCGFSRENAILRVTLDIEQVAREAAHLARQGFRHILLVAGEHPKFVSNGYLEKCIRRLTKEIPSISLEIAPMETADYLPLVAAGAETLVVYQETYHRPTYAKMHFSGPKKNYGWRLDCPERAHDAGFRRIGIGALFGLWHWQEEALALAAHIQYLRRACWKSHLTVSLPRLRPAAGDFKPEYPISNREFIQLLCAIRVTFPSVGLILSTREPADFRDLLAPLGITSMSAGSHTEPGGYTGEGADKTHLTINGRPQENCGQGPATGQFDISDLRSPKEVADMLTRQGFEPVWKDWDPIISDSHAA
ncbi:MAG: 2-iminoacetate synthase ThiH [Chthoniobacterales bacterium]